MHKYFVFLILLTLIAQLVDAAKIYGNIYDFELNSLDNTVVSIGPKNKQIFVARNGSYSFNVPLGNYQIYAKRNPDLIAKETILVEKEGNYLVDLILLPDISEETFILQETIEDPIEPEYLFDYKLAAIPLILILIALLAYKFLRKKKITPKEDQLTNQVLSILKKEGGRITQKDLRKHLPYSEAKISLVISELENKKIVEKIKKGRGNIILLKEK
ncbi:hypothetical protein HY837_04335 [archaeon]|nr:hypothetical protein [archaeon]